MEGGGGDKCRDGSATCTQDVVKRCTELKRVKSRDLGNDKNNLTRVICLAVVSCSVCVVLCTEYEYEYLYVSYFFLDADRRAV